MIKKEDLRLKMSKATLNYEKLSCQVYYTKKMLESLPEVNQQYYETGIYGINTKEILQSQCNQLLEQKTYAQGYMQALKDIYEDFFDITEIETWMTEEDRQEVKDFRQGQKNKTINDYIYS